ncbi:MAG: Na(+)-translocating NADH-quinone reductase subunit A [Planctomycetota bacterium]
MSDLEFKIRRGLDVPISGEPDQAIEPARKVSRVGLLGADTLGLKPTLLVQPGDRVKLGQPLFEDKRNPGVLFTAPGTGEIEAVHRGERRTFQSLVIRLDGDEADPIEMPAGFDPKKPEAEAVRQLLIRTGLWTAFRRRPFSKVPPIEESPQAIFVNAMDTEPLAPDPAVVLKHQEAELGAGLRALTALSQTEVYVSTQPGAGIPARNVPGTRWATFAGPHPAGLPGTHIHFIDPVHAGKAVWTIGYQDVCAIGKLMLTGELDVSRVIAICGPAAKQPRLVRTRIGADLTELAEGETKATEYPVRMISGSVLSGRGIPAEATEQFGYLGRYARQLTLIEEGLQREFLGWHGLGLNKFSIKNIFASALRRNGKRYDFDTNTNGSPRAMVPLGSFEQVMPLDILPTFLLRSLLTRDTDLAQQLGALELDEEDLALCTFVCPGKEEYGPLLRENLTIIERDG